jgi:hypothetical protein
VHKFTQGVLDLLKAHIGGGGRGDMNEPMN